MWHPPHLLRFTGCVALFVAMTATATASAQNPSADAAFKRGRALMKAGKYREACEALEESQRLDPQLTTLFELGGCHEKIGKIATAWNDFREIATRDTDKRRRKKATEMVARLAPRVSKLLVQVDHDLPGLVVTMSSRDITEQVGVDIPVDPGSYAITATATGFKDVSREVKVGADGKVVTLQLTLEPIGGTSEKPPDKPPEPDIKPPPEGHVDNHVDPPPPIDQPKPPPTSRRKTYAVISVGVGVAAAGGMIYYGIRARSDRDAANSLCPGLSCDEHDPNLGKAQDIIHSARSEGTISNVLGVTSAVFIAAGAYLWFTAPDVTVTPTASASSAGVSVSGRF
jgi:hypothetical protein